MVSPREGTEIVKEMTDAASQKPLAWVAVIGAIVFGVVLWLYVSQSQADRRHKESCEAFTRELLIKIAEKNMIIEKKDEAIKERDELIEKVDSVMIEKIIR